MGKNIYSDETVPLKLRFFLIIWHSGKLYKLLLSDLLLARQFLNQSIILYYNQQQGVIHYVVINSLAISPF